MIGRGRGLFLSDAPDFLVFTTPKPMILFAPPSGRTSKGPGGFFQALKAWVAAAILTLILFPAGRPSPARASFIPETATLTSGGGGSSNTMYQGWGAIGLPVMETRLASPTWLTSAGFLAAFLLFPECDFNGNGIPDEDDPDDDGDGLADADELSGRLFDPATLTDPFGWDTDGDGLSDLEELLTGTNPRDPDSRLVVSIGVAGEEIILQWDGREGKTYQVLSALTIPELIRSACTNAQITAQGGTGLWRVAPVSFVISTNEVEGVFRLKVKYP